MLNYYDILQVSPNADPDVIQAAYQRLARKYHPDRNSDPSSVHQLQLLTNAFEVLSDPVRRQQYDDEWRSYQRAQADLAPATATGPFDPPAWLTGAVGGAVVGAVIGAIAAAVLGGSALVGGLLGGVLAMLVGLVLGSSKVSKR